MEDKGTKNVLGTMDPEITWNMFRNLTKGYEDMFPEENYECVQVHLFVEKMTVNLNK